MSTKKNQQFEKIIRKYSHFIWSNILKFHPQKKGIDPDDIFQEVKIKIWKISDSEKQIDNYSSYIKKIVDTTLIDQIRRIRREEGIILREKQKKIAEKVKRYDGDNLDNAFLRKKIGESIDSLLESRQKVVKLYLLSMSIEEISTFLDWSRDKTRNLLYRGLADLKQKLRESGIEYED
jgi:RNA polymerase sigma-70 factor (ECF subfamily)